jgi:chromosome partitioning protein
MNTTVVINPKGGSGKTTVAINLASYFAASNIPAALMDYDPQGSSLNWLNLRGPYAARIHSANGARHKNLRLRSMAMYVPEHIQQLIIDAPAGASGVVLQEILDRASCVIVPVAPSAIDIHATANFLKDVLISRLQSRNVALAIVANKVRRSTPVYEPLEWFLRSINQKLLARLIDSDIYLRAAESGVGIFEMELPVSIAECRQFMPIAEWVESQRPMFAAPARENIYEMPKSRFA